MDGNSVVNILAVISILQILPVSSIIGGQIAADYPFFVLVLRGRTRCGGTIVAEGAILTAAHCLFNEDDHRWARNHEISVFRGNFSTSNHWKGTTISVRNYKIHKLYHRNRYGLPTNYDIALIRLSSNLRVAAENLKKSILPICTSSSHSIGTFIGLGILDERTRSFPSQLMEATMLRAESCDSYSRAGVFIDDMIQLCYNGVAGAYVCHGDSGGPIVYRPTDEVICLIGISSFVGNMCETSRLPVIFTSASSLRPWVRRKIHRS